MGNDKCRILVKHSIWVEYELGEEEMTEQLALLRANPHPDTIEYQSTDVLWDTMAFVKPAKNEPTIEVWKGDAVIWNNETET